MVGRGVENHQKSSDVIYWTKITIFGLKMMMKSGLVFSIFNIHEPLQSFYYLAKPIQPNWLNS
jgi:hypothetical protein